jgi:hypothetical protein
VATAGDYSVFGQLASGGWLAIGSQNRAEGVAPDGSLTVMLHSQKGLWYVQDGDAGTSDWEPLRATRTADGMVVLGGLITDSGWRSPGAIAQLPEGFRPDARVQFALENNDTAKSIDVRADGWIVSQQSWTDGYISLDGISFPAAGIADWVSPAGFSNSWHSSGSNYGPTGFWLDSTGCVWVRGQIVGGSSGTDNTPMVQVPSSAYNSKYQNHMVATSGAGYGGVGILNGGGTLNWKPNTVTNWLSLGGVWYETAASTLSWTAPTLKNGWVNSATTGAPPIGYTKLANGLVRIRGLGASGTLGQPAFTLPAGLRPKYQLLFDRMSNNAFGRLDVRTNGDVVPQAGSNAWFSFDTLVFLGEQ